MSRVLAVLGVVLIVLAGVWKLVAPGQLVKYPLNVDKTFTATGGVTLYADAATLAPSATPTALPLTVKVRLHVVDHSSSKVVVEQDQNQKIGPLKPLDRKLQFVFDRRTIKNVSDPRAYAFDPSTVVDRSPYFAVNFPIHTGKGPYQVWKDETGSAFPMSQVAQSKVVGVPLVTMKGTMSNTPVQGYYIDTLSDQGIPKTSTLPKLQKALEAQGIDPIGIEKAIAPNLTADDRAAALDILSQPVNLDYLLNATTTMVVEPVTGVIVSLSVDQTFYAQPDIAQIGRLQTILGKPQYADNTAVKFGFSLLAKLVNKPPSEKVLRIQYVSTPASVVDVTHYANGIKSQVTLAEKTVPLALLGLGILLLLVGLALGFATRGKGKGGSTPAPSTPAHGGSPTERDWHAGQIR